MKTLLSAAVLSAALLVGAAHAKDPARNVGRKRHPRIAAAQKLVAQAYAKIVAAQKANEYDMEGHAAKAKDLLDQANAELKLAAESASENKN